MALHIFQALSPPSDIFTPCQVPFFKLTNLKKFIPLGGGNQEQPATAEWPTLSPRRDPAP